MALIQVLQRLADGGRDVAFIFQVWLVFAAGIAAKEMGDHSAFMAIPRLCFGDGRLVLFAHKHVVRTIIEFLPEPFGIVRAFNRSGDHSGCSSAACRLGLSDGHHDVISTVRSPDTVINLAGLPAA